MHPSPRAETSITPPRIRFSMTLPHRRTPDRRMFAEGREPCLRPGAGQRGGGHDPPPAAFLRPQIERAMRAPRATPTMPPPTAHTRPATDNVLPPQMLGTKPPATVPTPARNLTMPFHRRGGGMP